MAELKIKLNDADDHTRAQVAYITLDYTKMFLDKLRFERLRLSVKTLRENVSDHQLSSEDMFDFATDMASKVGIIEKKKWVRNFKELPLQKQYEMMKTLQDTFYNSLPKESSTKIEPYRNNFFEGNIIHTDVYYIASANIRKYILPYVKGWFLNETCPICLENFQEGSFLLQFPCQHSLHSSCFTSLDDSQDNCRHLKCPLCRNEFWIYVTREIDVVKKSNVGGRLTMDIYLKTTAATKQMDEMLPREILARPVFIGNV
ncbi:hypothetical protein HELRODRAFT_172843 [Helobdella robusta]|uniref:RING-type domain-containing protein n=1 Tax=Helobdella robusta TaxID=6412 RepID=T1F602_HELRO|nr:hypothetical protein HELRODRAFT_172843 [Helobdella robusta]ESO04456.1 hypothetical protein HELRODRAFT_172843 [Helobdella robusta]